MWASKGKGKVYSLKFARSSCFHKCTEVALPPLGSLIRMIRLPQVMAIVACGAKQRLVEVKAGLKEGAVVARGAR